LRSSCSIHSPTYEGAFWIAIFFERAAQRNVIAARSTKVTSAKLLKDLEAARIEPMNKGFAVLPGHLSLSIMECDRPVFVDLIRDKHGTGPGEFDVV